MKLIMKFAFYAALFATLILSGFIYFVHIAILFPDHFPLINNMIVDKTIDLLFWTIDFF